MVLKYYGFMRQSSASKRRCAQARKVAGLCRDCPNVARAKRSLCADCLDKQLRRQDTYASERPWVKAASHRQRVYGITPERYIDMLFDQNGRCGMCHQFFFVDPDVDHDHETGEARELLCHRCNAGLAYIEDAVFRQNAEDYLRRVKNVAI